MFVTIIVYYIRVYVTHTIPLEIPREGTPRVISEILKKKLRPQWSILSNHKIIISQKEVS